MTGDQFADLGIAIERSEHHETHMGGAANAPHILIVPIDNYPVPATRAGEMNLTMQSLEGREPFVSLALASGYVALYLALTAEDLRSMANAFIMAAGLLDDGRGVQ